MATGFLVLLRVLLGRNGVEREGARENKIVRGNLQLIFTGCFVIKCILETVFDVFWKLSLEGMCGT